MFAYNKTFYVTVVALNVVKKFKNKYIKYIFANKLRSTEKVNIERRMTLPYGSTKQCGCIVKRLWLLEELHSAIIVFLGNHEMKLIKGKS